MKLLAVIFCLVVSASALAQSDTSAKTKPLDSAANKDALYVIDGVTSRNKLKDIDPKDIFSISILKNDSKDPSMNPTSKSVVIVVTKQSAIKIYEKRFCAFSKKYKEHLESHQDNDEDISYSLNGTFLSVKPGERTRQLYEIPANKIKAVVFTENQYYNGGDSRPYIVIITTKK